jgi:hypothetical protein
MQPLPAKRFFPKEPTPQATNAADLAAWRAERGIREARATAYPDLLPRNYHNFTNNQRFVNFFCV